jgi:hypothetical protein
MKHSDYIKYMPDTKKQQIVDEYEQLMADGCIGDCFLRECVKDIKRINDVQGELDLFIMRDLATECYRYFYNEFLKLKVDFSNLLDLTFGDNQ